MRSRREFSNQAIDLLKKRYYKNDECWEDLASRIATFAANDNKEYTEFYNIIHELVFLPNTPCIANAGTKNPQVAACFLLPIEDSLDSIFQTLADAAKIYQSGGGVGINFSSLRPEGAPLSRGGASSGPISFLRIFNEMTEQVKQGSMRRGAGIALLSIDHPDIVKFIKCKNTEGQLSNFNISIAMTNAFMNLLQNAPNTIWTPRFNNQEYWIERATGARGWCDGSWCHASYMDYENDVAAYTVQDIWNLICDQVWKNGEPGLLFIDTAKADNDSNVSGCNPCGEVIMEPNEACVLGSIDVSRFVEDGVFNWDEFKYVAMISTMFLNRILDKGTFPLQKITDAVRKNRRIGLGIMGLADALILMKVKYGSPESLQFAKELAQTLSLCANKVSKEYGFNNHKTTCIAPTGSLSILAGCSSGCEPIYDLVTTQTRTDFGTQVVAHPLLSELNLDPKQDLPDYVVTAKELTYQEHIDMQAALQSGINGSISKTINMPASSTPSDISLAYLMAWDSYCKGITIYRDQSRQVQVVSSLSQPVQEESKNIEEDVEDSSTYWEAFIEELGLPKERPYCLDGFTFKLKLDLGGKLENVYVTVTTIDSKPYEIFVYGNVRDADQIIAQYIDTVSRLISLSLRGGVPLEMVITQLRKVPCSHVFSIPHKLADILQEFLVEPSFQIQQPEIKYVAHPSNDVSMQATTLTDCCPNCAKTNTFIRVEGCLKCRECGWSKCG